MNYLSIYLQGDPGDSTIQKCVQIVTSLLPFVVNTRYVNRMPGNT